MAGHPWTNTARALAPGLAFAFASACGGDLAGDPARSSDADGAVDAAPADAPFPDQLVDSALTWNEQVTRTADAATLFLAFLGESYAPPEGTEILAARVERTAFGLVYTFHQINDGVTSEAFWPASTVKLHSSLAALDFIESQGFSSAATVTWASGYSDRVDAIIGRAIRVSSNEDYDRTIRIAGYDHLNATWLSPERGFAQTVIKGGYAGFEVKNPPGYTLTEGAMTKEIPARAAMGTYTCASGKSNCTTLFELVEAVRRVVLHDELADGERFALLPADREMVKTALCSATPSFFAGGVTAALGEGGTICHKPGWYPGLDSLDHGVITAPNGDTYLLAVAVPDPGDSSSEAALAVVAEHTLRALAAVPADHALVRAGPTGGVPIALAREGSSVRAHATGATRLDFFLDADFVALARDTDGTFVGDLAGKDPAGKLLTLAAFGGAPETLIGFRTAALP